MYRMVACRSHNGHFTAVFNKKAIAVQPFMNQGIDLVLHIGDYSALCRSHPGFHLQYPGFIIGVRPGGSTQSI
jgi:predicted glycoside hydrolase/deacetylase ChbG (UPF0249 family)